MRSLTRSALALVLGGLVVCAWADRGFIEVSSFPSRSVADGRSTVTISASVRDQNGKPVPDGTKVRFNTTLGNFKEQIVNTVGGTARAILVAGGIPGTAQITASGLGIDAPPTTFDYEFVGDRSDLSSAFEFVEIYASGSVEYSGDKRIIAAYGSDQGVFLRYRDVTVNADSIEFDVNSSELRARKAKLKIGRWTRDFEDLYFRVTQRKGQGITTFRTRRWNDLRSTGRWLSFFRTEDGKSELPPEEDRFGVVDIRPGQVTPSLSPIGSKVFEFTDIRESRSLIAAKKAVVFPRKEIQFQSAEMLVDGARVMKVPLFQLNLMDSRKSLITDQFFNINDNQVAVNYPHYLSLKPGQTSLLRFRAGGRSGRSTSGANGMSLDYELNWNRGDEMQGGMTFSGIARDDWAINFRHSLRLDERTDVSTYIDIPQGESIYGSAQVSRQFTGFTASASANANRTLRGLSFRREDFSFNVEKNPIKAGRLPVRLTYGVDAQSSRLITPSFSSAQTTYGVGVRAQSLPLALDSTTTLSLSTSARKLLGVANGDGVSLAGTASITKSLGPASLVTSYDYLRDGFGDQVDGNHRLSMQGYYDAGNTSLSVMASRSLDVDRFNIYGDLSYRFSKSWRFSYGYTFDRYLGESFFDTTFGVGYRLGYREVGLIWSRKTNRIGVQLLGAQF